MCHNKGATIVGRIQTKGLLFDGRSSDEYLSVIIAFALCGYSSAFVCHEQSATIVGRSSDDRRTNTNKGGITIRPTNDSIRRGFTLVMCICLNVEVAIQPTLVSCISLS